MGYTKGVAQRLRGGLQNPSTGVGLFADGSVSGLHERSNAVRGAQTQTRFIVHTPKRDPRLRNATRTRRLSDY